MWGDAVTTDKDGYKITEILLGETFAILLGWHISRLNDPQDPNAVGALSSSPTLYRFSRSNGRQEEDEEGPSSSSEERMIEIADDVTEKKLSIKNAHLMHRHSPVVKLLVHQTACNATAIDLLKKVLSNDSLERTEGRLRREVVLGASPEDLDEAYRLSCSHLCRCLVAQRELTAALRIFPEFEREIRQALEKNFSVHMAPAPAPGRAGASGQAAAERPAAATGATAAATPADPETLDPDYQVNGVAKGPHPQSFVLTAFDARCGGMPPTPARLTLAICPPCHSLAHTTSSWMDLPLLVAPHFLGRGNR